MSTAKPHDLAIEDVVERYFGHIYRAARGAGLGDADAEEVTQETFATFVEKAPSFEGRSSVRTFLFGILYNKVREHRRQLAKDRRHDSIEAEPGRDSSLDALAGRFDDDGRWVRPPRSPDARVFRGEVGQLIAGCMESAPTAQRLAFMLREVDGLSSEEICKILDVSSTNLGVMLHRFRNRVRECLEAQGVGSRDLPTHQPLAGGAA